MKARLVQCFFIAVAVASAAGQQPQPTGSFCRCSVTDIDGRQLSMADGHITIVAVVSRANQHDARAVGNHVPRQYYGDPNFRFVTVVKLQLANYTWLRRAAVAFIRHRLDLEAERLRPIYRAKKIERNPRDDLFAVADFDGVAAAQFGVAGDAKKSTVLVIGGDGRIISRWNRPPSSDDMAAALQTAQAGH